MLWDELIQLRPLLECTCGCAYTCNVAKATVDLIEHHLMQFLMGYDNVQSQIVVTEPLPSINKAYSMILHVERQRQVHMGESLEGATLFAWGAARKQEDLLKGQSYRKRGVMDK
ncbi:UNVERIFIED_CONTAM: hypothetical protein Sangu_1704500 [Sesamum angustifolium]|uniref:Uncharacterized protein n=1 Tax=Sesamum angustifolium TaxID=2727405 RepID=A0AAW2MJH2_9LAMI